MGMRTMLTRLAGKLDLPTDIAAGLPRIALNIGELTVEGQKLELRQMHRERLCITGRIERLSFGGAG